MRTYGQTFSELSRRGRAAVIPFFVIGDPDPETSFTLVKSAVDAGADVLELGVPFSDPIADGPTIQKADVRATAGGMNPPRALDFIRRLRGCCDVPIGLLMYYNLVYQYGTKRFFSDCREAGVNSVLVADLSIDDAAEVAEPAREAGLDTVFMATANTDDDRLRLVASKTTGFIYTVSLLGVTGSREKLSGLASDLVKRLKSITAVPVCVGFGIGKPEHAAAMASAGADGVIIGSRIVSCIEDNLGDAAGMRRAISGFLRDVRTAMDGAAG